MQTIRLRHRLLTLATLAALSGAAFAQAPAPTAGKDAMKDPQVIEKMKAQGATLVGDSPEHFRAFIDSEIKKWAKVIKDAGVQTTK